jgi:hypothetical protein
MNLIRATWRNIPEDAILEIKLFAKKINGVLEDTTRPAV